MPAPSLSLRIAPDLPSAVPGVWHADALGAGPQAAQPTGHALLDAQLPGGGWPVGALCEVLQPLAGLHEWQLVLPALAQATARRTGAVVAVAPPCEPFGPALKAQGLPPERLWVFRPVSAAPQASPALLRLQVQGLQVLGLPAGASTSAAPGLQVQILKRRGPPLVQALDLPGCHPRLAQALAAQAERRHAAQVVARAMVARYNAAALGDQAAPMRPEPAMVALQGRGHALDRIAAAMAG